MHPLLGRNLGYIDLCAVALGRFDVFGVALVVTLGCGKYAEIWDEETWKKLNLDEEPENFNDLLQELGL